ncbi:MAG TPA: PRC-barrel domain-containing protein [Solirubrobacteraceae bacterium]|nr:PRC-barrel domain-containing protein [Solirubrobacteraceae bacterium]
MGDAFDIGAPVLCSDGPCGTLSCVVVDPVRRAVTHVIVDPEHSPGQGRLVPVELVGREGAGLCLSCSMADFDELEFAEETQFVSPTGEELGYGEGEALNWPYYGLGMDMGAREMADAPRAYFASRVPAGKVEVRRGERVHAADGDFGRVHGFVVDAGDHHITHLLLDEGRLWGRKTVAVPMSTVKSVDIEGVTLAATKDELKALPQVDVNA